MAQSAAEVASASRTILFSTAQGSYTAAGIADFDRPTTNYTMRLCAAPFSTTIVSADFGGDAQLVYDGFGLPDSGGTITLQSGHLQRTIIIDAITGVGAVQ
jgi:hypothetical protein